MTAIKLNRAAPGIINIRRCISCTANERCYLQEAVPHRGSSSEGALGGHHAELTASYHHLLFLLPSRFLPPTPMLDYTDVRYNLSQRTLDRDKNCMELVRERVNRNWMGI